MKNCITIQTTKMMLEDFFIKTSTEMKASSLVLDMICAIIPQKRVCQL